MKSLLRKRLHNRHVPQRTLGASFGLEYNLNLILVHIQALKKPRRYGTPLRAFFWKTV